jgi:hypothetical protein
MSLSINELQDKVGELYPDVKQVGQTVLRFTKRAAESAFAVCFLDITKDLPANPKEVADYVERIVGPTYFGQPKSLQWNHYLYFVVDDTADSKVRQSKQIIEQDPTYARKFVIGEHDIANLLRPDVVQASAATTRVDAISRWIDALNQPHLIEAVFGNYTRADRLKLADGTNRSPRKSHRSTPTPSPNTTSQLPPLRKFKIDTYRPCLRGREFDFKDVNLLFGVNGAGKTSALEAIELYYCGKHTKRNKDEAENYKFHVAVLGGTSEPVTHSRPVSIFRDRNRDWYGVREQKQSHLYDSFGRFNFLDTDAAVHLARSDDNGIEKDLARLLVGSDAAIIWPVIEELAHDVTAELQRATRDQTQAAEDLKLLQQQLAESNTVKTESAPLRAALQDAVRRNKWKIDDHDLEAGAGQLAEQLSELLGVAQQALKLAWIDAPVTLDKCQQYAASAQEFIGTNTSTVQALESLTARQAESATTMARSQQAAIAADELCLLIEAGVDRRASDLAAQRRIITGTTSLLVGVDDETFATVAKAAKNLLVTECHDAALESRKEMETAANDARRESDQFAKLRQRSVVLGQQLRQLAREIIADENADECPLCHTRFKPGELARHIAIGVDEHVEAAAQKLLANVARFDSEYRRAVAAETALGHIVRYCRTARLSADATITDALAKISEAQTALNYARQRAEVLNSEIHSLKAQGISLERLNAVRSQLNVLGFNGAHQSADEVGALRSAIQDNIRLSSEEMKTITEAIAQLHASLETALRPWRAVATDPRGALGLLEERRVSTQKIQSRLAQFDSQLPWQGSRPIGEWIVEAESLRGIATKLQTALGTERVAAKTLTDTMHRRDQLQVLTQQLNGRISRLREANVALHAIVTDQSLEALTRSALQNSRRGIETIFSQIHSPAEFGSIEIDNDSWKLKRKAGDERVRLTQISSGQRAAFALSVFLAQNAQLVAGPPVILIDDPIAHVDDLNCLSFLDYLRELALTRKRQIFFATASDKLASLFERKFDFLGSQFGRFNLTRATNA